MGGDQIFYIAFGQAGYKVRHLNMWVNGVGCLRRQLRFGTADIRLTIYDLPI